MQSTKLLILGGGPGGYVAAIRAGQLGIATTLIEAEALGGTCLNIGCIPSKALIHAADQYHDVVSHAQASRLGIRLTSPSIDIAETVRWKDGVVRRLTDGVEALLKKSGVQVVRGRAEILDGKTVQVHTKEGGSKPLRIACEHLVLACGSQEAELPGLPFGGTVISSTQALSPRDLPRSLAVVGAGYIGLELGMAYRKLGVEVSIVESQARILPAYDAALSKPVHARLDQLGISVYLNHKVLGMEEGGDALALEKAGGEHREIPAQQVLVAVGRRPRTTGYGLESLMLDMDGTALRVDDRCRTSMRDVWAIGDITGEPMLAHRAMAQGHMVAELIAGIPRRFVPMAVPAVCFTDPEIVVVGLTPDAAARRGIEVIQGNFPFAANGRAMTLESTTGFVRVVARKDNHLILGWQAVGRGVAELSTAFSQSLEMGACLEDIAGTMHAHPTLGEAVQEAAMRALGHAVHA